MTDTYRAVVLAARPKGMPTPSDFAVVERELRHPRDGEVLIQNLYASLDAGFRHWMDEGSSDHILPEMPIGEPVMGLTLGRVVESRHPGFAPGDLLMARLAWEEYSLTDATDFFVKVPTEYDCPLSYHMGILGDTGMSAYFGIMDLARPEPGDTVLVSAAGGAVGSIAGQVAKIQGARTVGIVGGAAKARRIVEEFGYDAAIDRNGDVEAQLAATCPDGVNAYFDNVSGPLLEHVLNHIAVGARIVLCGAVATYNATEPMPGPSNLFNLVTNQARMEGFMTHLNHDRYPEARRQLLAWISEGKLRNTEYMLHGIENVGIAFCDLFEGRNVGKTVVRLVEDAEHR
jgi:hypothetical protein